MELRQLKYFIKAAELQSFSEAARALNIAQSTLSQQVRQLENELDIRLFDRQSNVIFLTEAAEEILPFARRTLSEAESCVAKVNDLAAVAAGTLNIGVTYSFSPILTETLIEFTKKYPRVKLNIFYKPMAELMEMLRNRSVDLVLAFRPSARYEDIESHVLFQNHLAVIIKENHPLAGNSSITFPNCRNGRWRFRHADCRRAMPLTTVCQRKKSLLISESNSMRSTYCWRLSSTVPSFRCLPRQLSIIRAE